MGNWRHSRDCPSLTSEQFGRRVNSILTTATTCFGVKAIGSVLMMLKVQLVLVFDCSLAFSSLDFDVARRTDLASIDPDTMFHFGLGQAF